MVASGRVGVFESKGEPMANGKKSTKGDGAVKTATTLRRRAARAAARARSLARAASMRFGKGRAAKARTEPTRARAANKAAATALRVARFELGK